MDVRCEKCGTVYDLDEAQLTDAGVTVRCTECDNVFRVRRRSVAYTEPVAPPLAASASDKPWQIRTKSGDVYTFKDLTTLQKWIVERKVSRDDEISRSGETWKRLGNIAELATFFQVVDQANAISTGATSPAQPAAPAPVVPPPAAPAPAPAPAVVP
ncbi:MAG: zinc-ribbon domain-containing protein, partial [Deltaproteobacteria bacterium]|nr:zinc-ribbon domain-containing protein [Deltaproteobacteria bacterium]